MQSDDDDYYGKRKNLFLFQSRSKLEKEREGEVRDLGNLFIVTITVIVTKIKTKILYREE